MPLRKGLKAEQTTDVNRPKTKARIYRQLWGCTTAHRLYDCSVVSSRSLESFVATTKPSVLVGSPTEATVGALLPAELDPHNSTDGRARHPDVPPLLHPLSDPSKDGLLEQLEQQARQRKLMLRLQVGRPVGLWTLRLVVARTREPGSLQLLGEMKGWAYAAETGLQLDTMRVVPSAPPGVGDLIWASTMAWSLAATPCRRSRLLAIRDNDRQHRCLVRYFQRRGFSKVRDLDAALTDLPLRLIWGGAGALMSGDIKTVLTRSLKSWDQSAA